MWLKQNLLLLLGCFLTDLTSAARVRFGKEVPVVSSPIDSREGAGNFKGTAVEVVNVTSNGSAAENSASKSGSVADVGTSGLQLLQGQSPNIRRKKASQDMEPVVLAPDAPMTAAVPPDSLLAVAIRTEAFLGKDGSRCLSKLLESAGVLSAALLGVVCLLLACWTTSYWSVKGSVKGPRQHVEALAVCGKDEVQKHLAKTAEQGYDCALTCPVSSGIAVRLEGTLEREGTAGLATPLTRQSCVLYSAAVARKLHDGMHPVPVAFATASESFQLVVKDSPDLRVDLRGEDIFLFDMKGGWHTKHCSFADAPDHWQDFVLTHRAAALGGEFQPSSTLRAEGEALEFQECALLVGAQVTAVGELLRSSDGRLSLRPCASAPGTCTPQASRGGLTSWERASSEAFNAWPAFGSLTLTGKPSEESGTEAGLRKVMISDDPTLLASSQSTAQHLLTRCGL
mmetsp:Transcript_46705/g.84300  ORF Transcript_46705/g.84300 Transcript_46705/m.84300 type:complete len:455 (+) Transcript_46705:174-1538(+)|eukprot:CAMPEP_0197641250 /NCGR_PEP_ID=MMETSP1338-20131121/15269_1 /TAXON_ID=43686 ORGANISM="Pelagodinium beii, Strain RCC1491" /NCGR_SAMPLE_ID=MMETSP1338 /ASSEMBLY_ACC=CAM_ASM_000754 /LENGTH=454 /DNA_ID=CAMNT_0043214199 /DNA_START=69 /DNA_END=1433 /DNA_ORIENTATION=+